MTEPRHLAILASAGTGKTFRLSGRYLRLLLEGVPPERILATTFTRKAAAEILARVLRRLAEAAADADAASRLARELGLPAAADPGRCALALERFTRAIDRVLVCTIDSFLVRIATGSRLDLGFPAAWKIVEEDEEIRDEALGEMIAGASPDEMVELLRLLAAGEFRSSVVEWLEREIGEAYDAFTNSDAGAWRAFAAPDAAGRLDDAGVRIALNTLLSLGVPDARYLPARAAITDAAGAGDWLAFVSGNLVQRVLAGETTFAAKDIPQEWRRALAPLIEHARVVLLGAHAHATAALRTLLERFDGSYRGLQRARGVCRFDDVSRMLLDAGATGDLDALYYRLDGRIDHLLLDEFQDTSLDQFNLLRPVLEELLAGGDRSVLCVGDTKQSLYQWRRAEPELLPAVPRTWPQVAEQPLVENRRSSPVILACVDRVFGGIATNPAIKAERPEHEGARRWGAAYRPHTALRTERGFACLREAPEDREAQRLATLRFGAEQAAQVARRAPWASIGVLARTRAAIPRIIHALRSLGVEASEEGGSRLDDSPAVGAALSALRLADHPGDSAACFHLATSPLGEVAGVTAWDDAASAGRWASRTRREIAREGLARVLARWLAGVAGACSARDVHRFEQLVCLAGDHAPRTRTAEFVALVSRTQVDDPTPERVRVMTVHQAKGLEFDAVVLPELNAWLYRQTPALLVERPGPLAPPTAVCRYARREVRALEPRLERIDRQRRARAFGEALCLLYVAMTRARRALVMVVDPPGRNDLTLAAILKAALARDGSGPETSPDAPLWSEGDPQWADDGPVPARAAPEPAAPLRLDLAPVDRASLRHLRRASPSALHEGAISPALLLSLDDGRAAKRGEVVHAWFERIAWLEDGEPTDDDLAADAARVFPRGYADLARDLARFRALLRSGPIADLLHRGSYEHRAAEIRVARERPFAVRVPGPPDGRPLLLEGRIDRLVLGFRAGEAVFAEIVDFKTDSAEDAPARRELAERYAPQMNAYREAVSRLSGLDPGAVGAKLVFVSSGAVTDALRGAGARGPQAQGTLWG